MASDQQISSSGAELESVAALLRLASHRCGHEVELTFDPHIVAAARAADGVLWDRDEGDPEAGPRFRAAAAIVCDGRCVSALIASGAVTPDDDVAEVVAQAAIAAGRLIRPMTWRMLHEHAGPEQARTAA